MPNLTEELVIKIADQVMFDRKLKYDNVQGLRARFDGKKKLREGNEANTWTVTYLTVSNPVFEQDMHFIYVDDATGEVLYIITPTNYIE